MKIPGFTAETSLYKTKSHYYLAMNGSLVSAALSILPQQRIRRGPLPNIEARFRAYAEKLSTALGHADRVEPFSLIARDCCCLLSERVLQFGIMMDLLQGNSPLKQGGFTMKRKVIIMVLLAMIWPTVCFADLTGKWSCDDGGAYYLRQIGNTLYWYGERAQVNPQWSNVFVGTIQGNQVNGRWADVPKGQIMQNGQMRVRISPNGNSFEAIHKTGGFGGSRWWR